MRRGRAPLAALCSLVLLCGAGRAAAQGVPPDGNWRTITTAHFRVHFLPQVEGPARRAAAQAEIAYAKLAAHLHTPRGVVDLVIADNVDFSNGFTTVFPTNRITIYALPGLDDPSLEFYDSWFEQITTHELTHTFQLDRTAGWWAIGQDVLGRAPLLFPNTYEPAWMTEGLAVYYESALTDAGRVNGTISSMVVRSTAQQRALPYYDRWSLATTVYPYGNISYDYGAEFLDYLATVHGEPSLGDLVERASRRPIPFTYNGAASGAFGISFADGWQRWRDSLALAVHGLPPAAEPMNGWRDLTHTGYDALRPRWADDGSLLYAGNLGKSFTAAYSLDTTGAERSEGRRNSGDTQVPMSNGGILYAQLEYTDPYHVRSDLYTELAGKKTKLTHGARLAQPDARGDGAIVAVRYEPATTTLVRVSADGRAITPLTGTAADTEWAEPRWSPNGALIAATRWTRGAYADVVVMDTAGRIVRTFTHDRAFNASPSWSPNGRAVLFTSNRTGAQNVYIALVEGDAPPRRIGNASTGMFYPTLSPDGRTLVAVRYDADGDHVGIAPFDTSGAAPTPLDSSFLAPPYAAAVSDSSPSTSYSPFPALWPHYWLPAIALNTLNGVTFGAYTSGSDVIGRHAYYVQALFDPWHYQNVFDAAYAYAGLGQPVMSLEATQYWDQFNDPIGPSGGTLFRRTRAMNLTATLRRLRVYSTAFASLSAGILQKHYTTTPDSLLPLLPAYYSSDPDFWSVGAAAGYANAATPPTGVSPEDGISTNVAATFRWLDGESALWSQSLQASMSGYVALAHGSFAHPVLRARVAAGATSGSNPMLFDLGGVSGGGVVLLPGVTLGSPRYFPVRGFTAGVESGERIVSGTVELVLPLAGIHHGFGFFPIFLDRSSLTLFSDAGSSWAPGESGGASTRPVASAGAEVTIFVGVPYDAAYALRFGVAVPYENQSGVATPAVTFYFTLGVGN